ncbi:hypothetical protein ABW19_dt0201361 [Dactylella cylindrospora]|nr:hypothetical protein ABW19_dt0201361 [Dactylella cylindrospora]
MRDLGSKAARVVSESIVKSQAQDRFSSAFEESSDTLSDDNPPSADTPTKSKIPRQLPNPLASPRKSRADRRTVSEPTSEGKESVRRSAHPGDILEDSTSTQPQASDAVVYLSKRTREIRPMSSASSILTDQPARKRSEHASVVNHMDVDIERLSTPTPLKLAREQFKAITRPPAPNLPIPTDRRSKHVPPKGKPVSNEKSRKGSLSGRSMPDESVFIEEESDDDPSKEGPVMCELFGSTPSSSDEDDEPARTPGRTTPKKRLVMKGAAPARFNPSRQDIDGDDGKRRGIQRGAAKSKRETFREKNNDLKQIVRRQRKPNLREQFRSTLSDDDLPKSTPKAQENLIPRRLNLDFKNNELDAFKAIMFTILYRLLFPSWIREHDGMDLVQCRNQVVARLIIAIKNLYRGQAKSVVCAWGDEFREAMRRSNYRITDPHNHKKGAIAFCNCCRKKHGVAGGIVFFGKPCKTKKDGDIELLLDNGWEDKIIDEDDKEGDGPSKESRMFIIGEGCMKKIHLHHDLRHFIRCIWRTIRADLTARRLFEDGASIYCEKRFRLPKTLDLAAETFEGYFKDTEDKWERTYDLMQAYIEQAANIFDEESLEHDNEEKNKEKNKERKKKAQTKREGDNDDETLGSDEDYYDDLDEDSDGARNMSRRERRIERRRQKELEMKEEEEEKNNKSEDSD